MDALTYTKQELLRAYENKADRMNIIHCFMDYLSRFVQYDHTARGTEIFWTDGNLSYRVYPLAEKLEVTTEDEVFLTLGINKIIRELEKRYL